MTVRSHPGPSGDNPSAPQPARAVILFCRAPQVEARLKRLPPGAADLFSAILQEWRRRARDAGAVLLVMTPVDCVDTVRAEAPDVLVAAQSGGPLGERLAQALADGRRVSGGPMIVAAGDAPAMLLPELLCAFEHLEHGPEGLLLAPADDGGINAIGVSHPIAGLFEGISWMTPRVAGQLRVAAGVLGLRLLELGLAPDLDTAADVPRLARATRSHGWWRPYRWLVHAMRAASPERPACEVPPSSATRAVPDSRGPPLRRLAA